MKFIVSLIMILMALNFACSSFPVSPDINGKSKTQNNDQLLFGNIFGTISDGGTGAPIKNAMIYVTETPVQYSPKASSAPPDAVFSDQGPVIIPDLSSVVSQASSGDDGAFIVNSIPISGSSQLYTVFIEAEGCDTTVIDQVLILPGAAMALRIDCRMTSDDRVRIIKIFKGRDHVDINYMDINYSDELRKPGVNDSRQ